MAKQFDADVVESKLGDIAGYVEELRLVRDPSLADYQADVFRKRGIEKTLINLIQAAVDVNNYLLARLGEAATDNYTSFVELADHGVLPRDFAETIAPAAGLRSRLVHEYQKIDDKIVHASIAVAIDQFTEYVGHVRRFMS